MTIKLTGARIEIYKVADYGGTETETLFAATKDDVELSSDVETASTTEHNKARVHEENLRGKYTLQFKGLLVSTMAALTSIGFLDGSSKLQPFVLAGGLDIRMKVYRNQGDASPSQKVAFRDTHLQLTNIKWPSSAFCEWSAKGAVNGDVIKEVIS